MTDSHENQRKIVVELQVRIEVERCDGTDPSAKEARMVAYQAVTQVYAMGLTHSFEDELRISAFGIKVVSATPGEIEKAVL